MSRDAAIFYLTETERGLVQRKSSGANIYMRITDASPFADGYD